MSDRIEKAAAARRRQAERQRQAARRAFEEMVADGAHRINGGISVVAVAKRAGVSRQLIYSMDDLCDQIRTVRDEQPARPRARGNDTDAAESANLKAKLAHAGREIDQLRKDKARLQRSLARALDGSSTGDGSTVDEVERLRGEVARLGADLVSERNAKERLAGELADLHGEHTAARERNRDLTRELMQLRQELLAASR